MKQNSTQSHVQNKSNTPSLVKRTVILAVALQAHMCGYSVYGMKEGNKRLVLRWTNKKEKPNTTTVSAPEPRNMPLLIPSDDGTFRVVEQPSTSDHVDTPTPLHNHNNHTYACHQSNTSNYVNLPHFHNSFFITDSVPSSPIPSPPSMPCTTTRSQSEMDTYYSLYSVENISTERCSVSSHETNQKTGVTPDISESLPHSPKQSPNTLPSSPIPSPSSTPYTTTYPQSETGIIKHRNCYGVPVLPQAFKPSSIQKHSTLPLPLLQKFLIKNDSNGSYSSTKTEENTTSSTGEDNQFS